MYSCSVDQAYSIAYIHLRGNRNHGLGHDFIYKYFSGIAVGHDYIFDEITDTYDSPCIVIITFADQKFRNSVHTHHFGGFLSCSHAVNADYFTLHYIPDPNNKWTHRVYPLIWIN